MNEEERIKALGYSLPLDLRNILDGFKRAIQQRNTSAVILFDGRSGMGKCEVKGDKVLMSDGSWKNVEDVNNGDEVISPQEDGSFIHAKVSGINNWFADEVYSIYSRADGKRLYSCSHNHLIPIMRTKSNRINKKGNRTYKKVLDTWEASKLFKHNGNGRSNVFSLFSTTAIDYKKKDCGIEPYSLGVYLGDGHFSSYLSISNSNKKTMDEVYKFYPSMSILKDKRNGSIRSNFSLTGGLAKSLVRYGLHYKKSDTKFIPRDALSSSIQYRTRLLAGLIDTDGYVSKKESNCITYTTQSYQLAQDICNLVFSLGGRSSVKPIKKKAQTGIWGNYFVVRIAFKDSSFIPLLSNKKERLGRAMAHDPRHITVKIEKDNPQQVYGFEIEGKSKWYITNEWMVTHNTTIANQCGAYCDPEYNLSKVHWLPKTFLEGAEGKVGMKTAKKGDFILFDEGMILSSRSSMSQINRMVVQAMSMIRSKNLIVGFCVNSIFDLDRNLALSRGDILLHVYGDSLTDRGRFLAFFKGADGTDRLKMLYLLGKKYYDYGKPKANFYNKFSRAFVLDDEEYEVQKQKAIGEFLSGGEKKESYKTIESRDKAISWIIENTRLTQEELAKICGIHVNTVKVILREHRAKQRSAGLIPEQAFNDENEIIQLENSEISPILTVKKLKNAVEAR